MTNRIKNAGRRLSFHVTLLPFLAVGTFGCDSFFEIPNPNEVNAEDIDPLTDGEVFSRSAFQTFADAYGNAIVYTAWFTNEAWVGDTFPTRNEFGRRFVDITNGTHNNEVWFPLTRGIAQAEEAIEVLDGEPGQDLNVARANLTSGFSLILMGEAFCRGTMRQPGGQPGPAMEPTEILETAVSRLQRAVELASGLPGGEAATILSASRVGIARGFLQLGQGTEAIQAAELVAPEFEFVIPYIDQPGGLGRLGNGVFLFSAGGNRESLVVPPHYREIGQDITTDPDPPGDPRIRFLDAGQTAQDGELRLWSQRKYDSWSAGIRLASGLEARYIAVEARNDPVEMRAFINERRAFGGHDPYDGDDLLGELMTQRSLDFWLEAKRMGDWRRNPDHVPNILPPGPNYYKPDLGPVESQTCLPIPFAETNANPNIP